MPFAAQRLARRLPSVLLLGGAAVLLTFLAAAPPARAQRESFDGSAERRQLKTQEDKLLDLNGDGKVDDYERELAMQNLLKQNGYDGQRGEFNKEKFRELKAQRERLAAEARARDKAEALAEKLREKKARGRRLSEAEETQLRVADQQAEVRRAERERQAREQAKAPASQAGQMLNKPLLDAVRY